MIQDGLGARRLASNFSSKVCFIIALIVIGGSSLPVNAASDASTKLSPECAKMVDDLATRTGVDPRQLKKNRFFESFSNWIPADFHKTEAIWQSLLWNDKFAAFLAQEHLTKMATDWSPYELKAKVISAYVYHEVAKMRGEVLEHEREIALEESLFLHGYPVAQVSESRDALKNLSDTNLKRIIDALGYKSPPEMMPAEELMKGYQLTFLHHSGTAVVPMGGLISSRTIKSLGFRGGIHSQNKFNYLFLGSDANVFFHLKLFPRAVPNKVSKSQYGKYNFILDEEYMLRNGWVSPFLMYASDFKNVTKAYFGEELPGQSEVEGGESWVKLRDRLHELDFTCGDFETLVKTIVLVELNNLRLQSPDEYKQAMRILKSKKFEAIEKVIDGFIKKRFGFIFEGKVPAAVEAEAITISKLKNK